MVPSLGGAPSAAPERPSAAVEHGPGPRSWAAAWESRCGSSAPCPESGSLGQARTLPASGRRPRKPAQGEETVGQGRGGGWERLEGGCGTFSWPGVQAPSQSLVFLEPVVLGALRCCAQVWGTLLDVGLKLNHHHHPFSNAVPAVPWLHKYPLREPSKLLDQCPRPGHLPSKGCLNLLC